MQNCGGGSIHCNYVTSRPCVKVDLHERYVLPIGATLLQSVRTINWYGIFEQLPYLMIPYDDSDRRIQLVPP